jgi:hypothetical protein
MFWAWWLLIGLVLLLVLIIYLLGAGAYGENDYYG